MSGRDTIVVLSSHVARGAVGNRVIVPVLEAAGFDVWAVPTVVLPYHPGVGPGTRLVPEPAVFASMLDDLLASGVGTVRAIVSGYLGDAEQARALGGFVQSVKLVQPHCTYVCDPVMGDFRGLYVPHATAVAIRDVLVPLADVITPNRYEHDWLTGQQCAHVHDWIGAARGLAPPVQLITSVPGGALAPIGNLLVSPEGADYCGHAEFSGVPHGTGDLVSALTSAAWSGPLHYQTALQTITQRVFDVVRATHLSGADDLDTRAAKDSSGATLLVHHIC